MLCCINLLNENEKSELFIWYRYDTNYSYIYSNIIQIEKKMEEFRLLFYLLNFLTQLY